MRFTHKGAQILLKGITSNTIICRPVSSKKLQGLLKRKSITHVVQLRRLFDIAGVDHCIAAVTASTPPAVPAQIQAVLDKFPRVFQEPSELPPQHACDHKIELIPGVQPVNARAYRLPPDQKD